MNTLQSTLQKLITDTWPGLQGRYYFAVPCRGQHPGQDCRGRFDIAALRQFLEEGDETYRCEVCRSRQKIVELLYGFEEEDTRRQLSRLEGKLDQGFAAVQQGIAELNSRLASYVMAILQALASEAREGPRFFTLEPAEGNWRRPVSQRYRLHLWCEAEGCQHPVQEEGKGFYEFDDTRPWVKTLAPYANFIAGVLKALLPLISPAVNVLYGAKTVETMGLKDHLDLMKEGTAKLLGKIEVAEHPRLHQGIVTEGERYGLLALHSLLRTLDPHQERLGLTIVPTYTGEYRWLCQQHYVASQSKIPDSIE